ncbi:hypothetical protein RYX36_035425, partial [Vicia faba]
LKNKRSHEISNLILLTLILTSVGARRLSSPLVDGYSPIFDINEPHVIEISNFVVTHYDKQGGAILKFNKIIKG